MTPAQNPKQRLHLNNSSKNFNLRNIFLGQFKIEPYFSMNVRPTQAIISIIFFIHDVKSFRNHSGLLFGDGDNESIIISYLDIVFVFWINFRTLDVIATQHNTVGFRFVFQSIVFHLKVLVC